MIGMEIDDKPSQVSPSGLSPKLQMIPKINKIVIDQSFKKKLESLYVRKITKNPESASESTSSGIETRQIPLCEWGIGATGSNNATTPKIPPPPPPLPPLPAS